MLPVLQGCPDCHRIHMTGDSCRCDPMTRAKRCTFWKNEREPTYDAEPANLSIETQNSYQYVRVKIRAANFPDEFIDDSEQASLDWSPAGWPIHCSDDEGTVYEGEIHAAEMDTSYTGQVIKLKCLPGEL